MLNRFIWLEVNY